MKQTYFLLVAVLMTTVLRGDVVLDEQRAKEAAQKVCAQQVVLLEKLKTYIEHQKLADKKDVIYQLSILKTCLANEETRIDACSLEQLADTLRATELVIENFEKNIPGHVAQVCATPTTEEATELKNLSAAQMLERYNKLQERIQALMAKIASLDRNSIDRLLDSVANLYDSQKSWLEPVVAASIFGTLFWQHENIQNFIAKNRVACSIVAALAYYLRTYKRSTIADLKGKLPSSLYYPLALCKWVVGSQEKALKVTFPYGTDIDITKVRAWAAQQEKLCGVPIVLDEDKAVAPFGFGNIAKFIGMKNDIGAPISFGFGSTGISLSALFFGKK